MDKTDIVVCMGSSCFARGNQENLAFLESYIEKNNLNVSIELAGSRCENKCANGPHVMINGVEYNEVTKEMLGKILSELTFEKQ